MSATGGSIVVVGAGSAGAVIAARLSEDPRRSVTLVEAGPGGPGGAEIEGPSCFEALAVPGRTWPDLVARRAEGAPLGPYLRGRGLGGSSAVNAMVALPGIPDDYDSWAAAGAWGWGWEDLAPWFSRTALPLRPAAPGEVGPVSRALLEALPVAAAAVPLTRDTAGRRVSTAAAYLVPAAGRQNLTVRCDALVDRVILTGRRCTGVLLATGEVIPADEVVLCAGAIHSPAILLRSGAQLPGIGRGLQDHPAVAIPLELVDASTGPVPTSLPISVVARRSSGEEPADLQLLPLDHVGAVAPGRGALLVALMSSRAKGTVTLVDDDPAVDPMVELHLLSEEYDVRRLRAGLRIAEQVLDHPALRAVARAEWPESGSDDALRSLLGDYVHAAGTCRMGAPDDPTAVVDPDCRVIGVAGLRVCDASVMPVLPRANPHLTVVAIAERLAAGYDTASSSSIASCR